MDSLIQDTLDYLRLVAKTTPSIFASQEEIDYFAPRVYLPKKEPLAPPVQLPKKTPVVQQKAQEPPPPPPKPAPLVERKQIEELLPQREEILHDLRKRGVYDTFRPDHIICLDPPLKGQDCGKQIVHDIRQTIEKTFPGLPLRDAVLDDSHAKRMARLWEETYLSAHIVVIAFGEVGPGLEFLRNVTQAIDRLIAPAQLIEGAVLEKQQEWELLLKSPSLKGILCSPWASWKTTSLSQYYRQNGATQEQFLAQHKLFLLEPSVTYLKNPDRKRKLWHLISTQLLS